MDDVNISDIDNSSAIARNYSPIVLWRECSAEIRLSLLTFFTIYGTIMNGFFVASFMTEKSPIKINFLFLACVGVADFMVSSIVIPISTYVLLSGDGETTTICKLLAYGTELATYSYSSFFLLVAIQNYNKISTPAIKYRNLPVITSYLIMVSVFSLCSSLALLGVYFGLDYDYCERKHHGHFYYRIITTVLFYAIPCFFTIFCLMLSVKRINRRARHSKQYRRSVNYIYEKLLTRTHLIVFSLYTLSWVPYLVIIYKNPDTSDAYFYNSIWLGVCRFIMTSSLYATIEKRFRNTFIDLCKYCFCRHEIGTPSATLYPVYKPKERMTINVHIMQHAVNKRRERLAAKSDSNCKSTDL